MAPLTNVTDGQTMKTRKRTRRRRTTGAVRSGVATGVGSSLPGNTGAVMGIDHFGSYIRGAFEGFALANHIQPQQLLNGSKKYLTW